jgi:hypothetical protein
MVTVVQDRPPSTGRALGRAAQIALVGVVALLLALAGYVIGSHRGGTHAVTGPAQVGVKVVSMTGADGTVYGFTGSMPWIDASGSWHDGGWPECLGTTTTLSSATFGVTRVDYPNGSSAEQVVYVDCRH